MISRFFHSFGAFGRRRDFYIPLNPVFAFLLAFSTTGMILFFPAWSEKRPLTVDLREKLDSSGFSSETRAAVKLGNMVMIEDPAMAQFPQLPADPASFVQVSSTSRKFIERRLSELSIDTAIPAGKIEVTISDPDNVAVFEASRPFELLDAGRQCRFTSTENPTTPLIISFSSARDAKLTAHIRVWTRVNPRGLSIKNPDVSTSYLFEIDRAYAFPDNGEE